MVALLRLTPSLLVCACASVSPPAPGTGTIHGRVSVSPRSGAESGGLGAYGDRALREVQFVDYTDVGFAVVFTADRPPAEPRAGTLRYSHGRYGGKWTPRYLALPVHSTLEVHNDSPVALVLSSPQQGVLQSLDPGETWSGACSAAELVEFYALDGNDTAATVFVAPGPFAVTSSSGTWSLADLVPGEIELTAWHPFFPPAHRQITVPADSILEVPLTLSVDNLRPSKARP